ncbi:MAG: PfkB family carbohydrate kinase [Chloroflexota bacterium]|nr:PfkB family carbohydrate kinase [Chloroflexota bacterium]
MKQRILSYGEIIFDVVEGVPFLGGAPLNFAWFVNQLGGESTLASAVGSDDLGSQALLSIESYGINGHIKFSGQPTGTAIVNSDGNFDIDHPAAWDQIDIPDLEDGVYDLLYMGTLAQTSSFNRERLAHLVQSLTVNVFLDLNLRPPFYSKEIIFDSLRMANIVKVNVEEWQEIKKLTVIEDPFGFMEYFNLSHLAITMGYEGARFFFDGQELQYRPRKITEVDPTGAGDAFSAGFAMGILLAIPEINILKVGCEAGAAVAANRGAHMKLPNFVRNQLLL